MNLLGLLTLFRLCWLEEGRQGCSRLLPPWATQDKPALAVLSTWPSGLPRGASWAEGVTQVYPTPGCLSRQRLWLVCIPWAVSWVAFETMSPLCCAGMCLCSCSSMSWRKGVAGVKCRSCSQVGYWLGDVGHVEGEGQLCWSCRNDSGCERWIGGPLSQLSLSPGRVIKITAICGIQALLNLACPPPSQLPSTLAAQLTGMGTGRAASPASEMFVLSRSLAVNDFLRGGSWPGPRSQRSTLSCGMLCVLAAIGCRELCPLLWGSCQSSLSAGKEGRGSFPFPVSPALPGGYLAPQEVGSSTIAGWDPAPHGMGAPFQGAQILAQEWDQLPAVLASVAGCVLLQPRAAAPGHL